MNKFIASLTATMAMTLVAFAGVNPHVSNMELSDTERTAKAESAITTSDEKEDTIAKAIVTRADATLVFINDGINPWIIKDGSTIQNGNCGKSYSSSTLTISYTSPYKTELSFDWACRQYYSDHALSLYIDGIETASTTNSSYKTQCHYIEAGTHVIVLRDTITDTYEQYDWSQIKNLSVKEIRPLETAVLSPKSQPLTFSNNGEWPWTIEDGYIQNTNYNRANTASSFSTTFTITKPSKFSFWSSTYCYDDNGGAHEYSNEQYFDFKINGERYMGRQYGSGTTSVLLEPGTYTMEWRDTTYRNYSNLKSRISNVELSSNWVNVELASAGTLGVEVLYKVDVLADVELLKIKGPINSTDWTNIAQMTNLIGLDLTEATFDAVPTSAFSGLSRLSNVKLPEGIKSIGNYAFEGTQIWNITIPASVTWIGDEAFAYTRLKTISFPEDSKLSAIWYQAFRECTSLQEFIMPNTVKHLYTQNGNSEDRNDANTFYGCSSLKRIHFSDSLTAINRNVCNGCSNLTDLHLPKNLSIIRTQAFYNNKRLKKVDFPETLMTIQNHAFYQCNVDSIKLPLKLSYLGAWAFGNCDSLKYIELPSYIGSYDRNFCRCNGIKTVVCPSATPPTIQDDPFDEGSSKSGITLKVPTFAVVNYKLDKYWYQFGNIVEGDDIDYWKITSALSLSNNRRMNGKPDIDLYYGGRFTVGGNAPMEAKNFDLYVSESNPGRLLNTCEAMTADSINSYFSANEETWYFITPLHDVDLAKVTVSNNASFVFRYYDGSSRATNGTGNSWRNVDNNKLVAGQGYIFRCNKDALVTFPAESSVHAQVFNTADVSKALNVYEADESANKSWNYVGNPYPCYFDIYYMDFTAPITVWTGSTYKAYSIADDNYALRPMQAFFVQKPDAVDNIVFRKEGRQLTSDISHPAAAKSMRNARNKDRYLFDIRIASDTLADETRVVINDKASMGYEMEHDASKFMSIDSSVPQTFTIDSEGNRYAINERPLEDSVVTLAYYAASPGKYTITATRTDGDVYLRDALLNKSVNLKEQDYTFHSNATDEADTSRFTLTFSVRGDKTTDINGIHSDKEETGNIYDLEGRRITKPTQKGIYIQNGKKVILK